MYTGTGGRAVCTNGVRRGGAGQLAPHRGAELAQQGQVAGLPELHSGQPLIVIRRGVAPAHAHKHYTVAGAGVKHALRHPLAQGRHAA